MLEKQTVILNQLGEQRKDLMGFHRFLNNDKVDHHSIINSLTSHCGNCVSGRDIVCIQDTTEYNYHKHRGRIKTGELGPVGNDIDIGYFAHPTLAIDAVEQYCIGFGALEFWCRSFDRLDKDSRAIKKLPIEEKESYRWLSNAEAVKKNLHKANHLTILADREADIFELFDRIPDQSTDLIIRSRCNRNLIESGDKLYEHVSKTPELGRYHVMVGANAGKGRTKHEALLAVKTARVKVKRPAIAIKQQSTSPYVELNVVQVSELQKTVKPGEPPVHWILLTTLDINNFEQACDVVQKYCLRWQIEQLFRISKKGGINLEASQMESQRGLLNLGALALQVAMKILQLTQARDVSNNVDAKIAFTETQVLLLHSLVNNYEGATEKQKNPYRPGSLPWASWIIARMGGWKGYRSQAIPGPITIFKGLVIFKNMYLLYQMLKIDV